MQAAQQVGSSMCLPRLRYARQDSPRCRGAARGAAGRGRGAAMHGGKEVFGPMLQCHANRHGPGSATALQSPVHSTCTPRFGHKAPLHVRLTAHQSVSQSG